VRSAAMVTAPVELSYGAVADTMAQTLSTARGRVNLLCRFTRAREAPTEPHLLPASSAVADSFLANSGSRRTLEPALVTAPARGAARARSVPRCGAERCGSERLGEKGPR
jgi:hypothetical protein